MPTDETGRVARAYHDAWTNRKGPEALRELMAEEFVFDSAMMHIEGRDQFLAGAGAREEHLALRLPLPERDAFLAKYQTVLCEQHGKVMKEYVEVPDSLLRDVDELAPHFEASYTYVSSLKPKPTRRRGS
jgi:hypothetical protein